MPRQVVASIYITLDTLTLPKVVVVLTYRPASMAPPV